MSEVAAMADGGKAHSVPKVAALQRALGRSNDKRKIECLGDRGERQLAAGRFPARDQGRELPLPGGYFVHCACQPPPNAEYRCTSAPRSFA